MTLLGGGGTSGGKPPGIDGATCAEYGCKSYFNFNWYTGGDNSCNVAVDIAADFGTANVDGACNCNPPTKKCGAVEGSSCTASADFSVIVTSSGGSYVFCHNGWSGAGASRSITLTASNIQCGGSSGGDPIPYSSEDDTLWISCGTSCGTLPLTHSQHAIRVYAELGCAACAYYDYDCK